MPISKLLLRSQSCAMQGSEDSKGFEKQMPRVHLAQTDSLEFGCENLYLPTGSFK